MIQHAVRDAPLTWADVLLLLQNEVIAWFIKANKSELSLDILSANPAIMLPHLCL